MSKENPLNVSVGDIVHLDMRRYGDEKSEFDVQITEVIRRYRSDLIKYKFVHHKDHDAHIEEYKKLNMEPHPLGCDVYYVTHIIQRAPFKKGCNVRENVYGARIAQDIWMYKFKNKHNLLDSGGWGY